MIRATFLFVASVVAIPSAFAVVEKTERFQCEAKVRKHDFSADGKDLGEKTVYEPRSEGILKSWKENGEEVRSYEYYRLSGDKAEAWEKKALRKYKVEQIGFHEVWKGEDVITIASKDGEEQVEKREFELTYLVAGPKRSYWGYKVNGKEIDLRLFVKESSQPKLGERLEVTTWATPFLHEDKENKIVSEFLEFVTTCTYTQTRGQ